MLNALTYSAPVEDMLMDPQEAEPAVPQPFEQAVPLKDLPGAHKFRPRMHPSAVLDFAPNHASADQMPHHTD